MSIYVARSSYRSTFARRPVFGRPTIKLQFPNMQAYFERRNARRKKMSRSVATKNNLPLVFHRNSFLRQGTVKPALGAAAVTSVARMKHAVMRFEIGPTFAVGGLLVVAILLSIVYLAHFNQVATKGYDLRRLEADRQQLLGQYDIKNMKLAEVKSLSTILSSERIGPMKRPAEIIYVRASTALAQVDSL